VLIPLMDMMMIGARLLACLLVKGLLPIGGINKPL